MPMMFEVKYAVCRGSYHRCDPFLTLLMKYRRKGERKYKEVVLPLDERAKNLGYGVYTASLDLDCYTYEQRVCKLKKALDSKYGGDLREYVKDFAKFTIIEMELVDNKKKWVEETVSGWLTKGIESMQVEIDLDKLNEGQVDSRST